MWKIHFSKNVSKNGAKSTLHSRTFALKIDDKKACYEKCTEEKKYYKKAVQYNAFHIASTKFVSRDFWVAWYSQSTTTKHFVRIHIRYFYWQFWSYKNKSAFAMHTISVTHVLSLTHNLGSRNIVHHSAECTNWVVRFLPKGLSKKGCKPNSGK